MQLEHIHPLKFLGAGAFANVFMVRAGVWARVRARARARTRARARARARARVRTLPYPRVSTLLSISPSPARRVTRSLASCSL